MFKPAIDRLDYSKMLTPPSGYETVFAVGATYSLDLDALVGISLALGLSESIDSALKDNPIYLLEALQKTADKVMIFCEGGQIKTPAKANALHILLEKMVFQVLLKNNKSFHPKFWLVKYTNTDGETLYRCLVLSRNLTFDRSWDVAVCIEGTQKIDGRLTSGHKQSQPIADFIKALSTLAKRGEINPAKKRKLFNLAEEILSVKFELNDKRFTDYCFLPVGIEGYDIEGTGLFNSYHELFIMSPFLSGSIIESFNDRALTSSQKNTLITRKSELPKLKPASVTKFNIYALKDIIVDGEETLSEGDSSEVVSEQQKQDIHAKMYLKTKYSDSELYLGSLNASNSACYGNVEFMVKLLGKKRYLNVDLFKQDVFGEIDKDNPFEIVDLKAEDKLESTVEDNLEKTIKDVCRLKSEANVLGGDGKYCLEVTFEKLPEFKSVYISPLLAKQEQPLTEKVMFTQLTMLQLSEFFIITAKSGDESVRRLLKIKTENMPETRESAIVNSIIKDKRGFIQYITFLLGDDYLVSMLQNSSLANSSFIYGNGEYIPALYEKMLKAAAHSPQKFADIKRLMDMLADSKVIPKGFTELLEVFQRAVRKSGN